MAIVTPPSRVLVTGANGYIAMWVVDTLLKKGYKVRGAIRREDKAKDLISNFGEFVDNGSLEFVVVEDITKDGAFDKAVKDVGGIIHMASPVNLDADDPQELIVPAILGTRSILTSALNHGNLLNRIVFTSSTAAILELPTEPIIFSEKDWNQVSVKEVESLGRNAAPIHKYRASKTLSEKSIWKFYSENKDNLKWDISVINPPFVFGPALNNFSDPSQQNATTKMWWDNIIANPPTLQSVTVSNAWVDVRDLGLGHVLALQKVEAGGERIIISCGPYVWQDWHDIAAKYRSPTKTQFGHHIGDEKFLPPGFPEVPRKRLIDYDTSKASKVLGPELKFRGLEQSTKEILDNYASRGW